LKAKAKTNAKVVDRLLAAGMIIIGKANMSVVFAAAVGWMLNHLQELGNMKGFGLTAGWSAVGGQSSFPPVPQVHFWAC
jgi:amidase